MLKIIYPTCRGMDVHKSFLVAYIAITNDQGVTTYTSKRASTFIGDLRRCALWLAAHDCKDVCMEYTKKTGFPSTTFWSQSKTFFLRTRSTSKQFAASNRKERRQVDRRYLHARSCLQDLYSSRRYPSASGFGSLPLEAYKLHYRRKEPCSELPLGFQHQTGRCVLRCIWQGCDCKHHALDGKSVRKNTGVSRFHTKGIKATTRKSWSLGMESCVSNGLKSSALSVLTWTVSISEKPI